MTDQKPLRPPAAPPENKERTAAGKAAREQMAQVRELLKSADEQRADQPSSL